MSKFGRFFWNNNDFINVFIIFIGGVTSLRSLALSRVHRNTGEHSETLLLVWADNERGQIEIKYSKTCFILALFYSTIK